MTTWIYKNRKWVFSGIGVFLLSSIVGGVIWLWSQGHIQSLAQYVFSHPMKTAVAILSVLLFLTSSMLLRRQLWGRHKPVGRNNIGEATPLPKIIKDGLKYMTENVLTDLARRGGHIVTTAIFENYFNGDKIQRFLEDLHITTKDSHTLEFTRLLLLDDPSKEYEWLKRFLELKNTVQPSTHGFRVAPRVHHIRSKERPLIRYLANSIPRVSVTTVKYLSTEEEKSKHLVYFGFCGGDEFGLAFHDPGMFALAESYLKIYKERATLYEDPRQVPLIMFDPRTSLIRRIQDRLLEFSEQREDIIHLGLFGSRSRIANQFLSETDYAEHEADLDIVIVMSEKCTINDSLKNTIVDAITAENLPEDPAQEIEFSNLENRYYENRSNVHIDIQLHRKGDRYYQEGAELLAYSIFSESYISLYSATREPLHVYLPHPMDIPMPEQRVMLAIQSQEYGLDTAIQRVGDYYHYRNTDPRRVLWIQLCNVLWAFTGKRPYILQQATESLKTALLIRGSDGDIAVVVRELLETANSDELKGKSFRLRCRRALVDLRAFLETGV